MFSKGQEIFYNAISKVFSITNEERMDAEETIKKWALYHP